MADQANSNPDRLAELQENFSECDANGDGRIQFDEFQSLLLNINAETSPEENRLGFNTIDTDNDGEISFAEFVAWFTDS